MKFWKICTKFYINVKGQVYSLQYCRRNFCVTSLVSPVVTQSGIPAKNKMTLQYLVWAPLARIPARILLCIESIRTLIRLNGMLFHSCVNAAINWARLVGGFWRFLIRLSSSSHRCSMGDMSGLYGGHSRGWTLFAVRKSRQTLATCGRALSCWKIRLWRLRSGRTCGWRIWSLYRTALRFWFSTTKGDFTPWEMPPQTITEAPPNLSRSTTHASAKRSPRLRYTLFLPSERYRLNLDSSVNITRLHRRIPNLFGPCLRIQSRRTCRLRGVRGGPT